MAQLTLEIPESLAVTQNKSVEQIALDHLRAPDTSPGSPSAILRVIKQSPYPDSLINCR